MTKLSRYPENAVCVNCNHHREQRPCRTDDPANPDMITHITCAHKDHRGSGPIAVRLSCPNQVPVGQHSTAA